MGVALNIYGGSLIPVKKGEKGDQGAQGVPGFAGPQAVPGSIGIPGQAFFGVGPIVPAGSTFYPIFAELFNPVHVPSGSFM